jgi:ATP-dependent DNA helicase DinG
VPPVPLDVTASPDVAELLAAAVRGIGGAERPGQVTMAEAVWQAIETGEHLAVQAGTGTGKSLAYLVPAVRHAMTTGSTVVVATATIALQRQLIDRDLPRLVTALAPLLGREPSFAILKGRRNYLCLQRQQGGVTDDPQDALFDPADTGPTSPLGRQVKRLHEWAEETETGDRDELVPGVPEAAWRQVSVSAQECVGAHRCRFGARCFAERARDAAARADIVVTNHALLAIDATSDIDVLPEHDVVVVDEAHDLVDRVTSATTGELSGPAVDAAARRAGRLTEAVPAEGAAAGSGPAVADKLRHAAAALAIDLGDAPAGRMDLLSDALAATLTSVQDAADACADVIRASAAAEEEDPQRMAAARITLASLDELQRTASRILDAFGEQINERGEVVWLDRPFADDARRPPTLRVAPLEVGRVLRARLFGERTVALTSATLALGGSFAPLAIQWGLPALGGTTPPDPPAPGGTHPPRPPLGGTSPPGFPWDPPRNGTRRSPRRGSWWTASCTARPPRPTWPSTWWPQPAAGPATRGSLLKTKGSRTCCSARSCGPGSMRST